MISFRLIYPALFLSVIGLLNCETKKESAESSPQVLFSADSSDWMMGGDAEWSFVDGALTGKLDSGGGFVMTKERFKNFELTLEFKPDSTINSGVFVRCQNMELSMKDCHEINIWDLHPNQDFRTGSIVGRIVPLAYVETLNKWNTYKIVGKNSTINVWVNEVKTAEFEGDGPIEGHIGLQASGQGVVAFRKVKLQKY